MKIGLFTDPHYSNKLEPSMNRYHSLSFEKIKEAMTFFKNENVDFVLCLGDLTDDCYDINDNSSALQGLIKMIDSFGLKFYSLMGNHDYTSFSEDEFNGLTNGAIPPFKIETNESVLVFLNCNFEDDESLYVKRNVDWTNTYLPSVQIDLLKKELLSGKEAYLFSHQNFDNEIDKNHIVRNSEYVRKVLKNGNVKMFIQGHFHEGHDTEIDGVKYHTLPAMCEGKENFFEILTIK